MKKYNHSNECGGGFVSLIGKIRNAQAQDFSIHSDEATWKTDGNERDNIKININNGGLNSIGLGPGPVTSSFEHINVASFSINVRSSDKLSN
jgi:hypothetical protein